jgi:GDPmannose 4,6-dehydratase
MCALRRPAEVDLLVGDASKVDLLVGDASKVERELRWTSQTTFEQLIRLMVDADLKLL